MKYSIKMSFLLGAVIMMCPLFAAVPCNEEVTTDEMPILEKYMEEGKWDVVCGVLRERCSDFNNWSLYTILMRAARAGAIDVVSLLLTNQEIFMQVHNGLHENLRDNRTLMGMILEAAALENREAIVDIIFLVDGMYEEAYRCDLMSIDRARSKARELGCQALEQKLGQKFAAVTKEWLWE